MNDLQKFKDSYVDLSYHLTCQNVLEEVPFNYKRKVYGNSTIITPSQDWQKIPVEYATETYFDYPEKQFSRRGKIWIKTRVVSNVTTFDVKVQYYIPLFIAHFQFATKISFCRFLKEFNIEFNDLRPYVTFTIQRIEYRHSNKGLKITFDRCTYSSEIKPPYFITAFISEEKECWVLRLSNLD